MQRWKAQTEEVYLPPFQYPRSDRAGCNCCDASIVSGKVQLSVSSVGSSGMQLLFRNSDATAAENLSVSSVGSSGMQLQPVPRSPRAPSCFQYPRSDRAGCNYLPLNEPFQPGGLSVSSVGSSGMQQVTFEL